MTASACLKLGKLSSAESLLKSILTPPQSQSPPRTSTNDRIPSHTYDATAFTSMTSKFQMTSRSGQIGSGVERGLLARPPRTTGSGISVPPPLWMVAEMRKTAADTHPDSNSESHGLPFIDLTVWAEHSGIDV
ncbi:unnamed protein product [Protopolystoma xenopodis]|uniref:Uncharacterized protein n=1 Tax=Protopolystoma xenopodis TaxID=117903 RepID=A0A448WLS4_9PLAT|nr:unnamed protein product [Protopolystoma xenopodis]